MHNGNQNPKEGDSKKKKRKPSGIHSVEEMEMMAELVDKTAWPMFSRDDSQRRCKELIVPVLIDEKSVDMELETGASVTETGASVNENHER